MAKVVKRSAGTAYVPARSVFDEYRGRKIAGVWDLILADKARREGANVLLMGDTGTGKTMFGEAYASKKRLPYYSVPCDVSIDPSALFGKMVPTDVAGKFQWQDGPVTSLVRTGGVLNLSEVNFMLPKIAAALYPLLDRRRSIPLLANNGENVRAHQCDDECAVNDREACDRALLIIADMNPGYRGTIELNDAFKNRFKYKVLWGYHKGVEEDLIGIPTLRVIAESLRDSGSSAINTPVSTNALMEFEKIARDEDFGLDFAVSNFISGLAPSERAAAEEVFKLNRTNLESDLNFKVRDEWDDEELEEYDLQDEGDF